MTQRYRRYLPLLDEESPTKNDPEYWKHMSELIGGSQRHVNLAKGLSEDICKAAKEMLSPDDVTETHRILIQLHLVRESDKIFDKLAREHLDNTPKQFPKPACHKSCSWCCYLMVNVTASELRSIQCYLETKMTPEQRAALWTRTIEASDRFDKTLGIHPGNTPIERHRQAAMVLQDKKAPAKRLDAKILCPFLVEGSCSIYPVRPLACRGYTSTSEQACKTLYKTGTSDQVAANTMIRAISSGLLDGLANVDFVLEDPMMELLTATRFLHCLEQVNHPASST